MKLCDVAVVGAGPVGNFIASQLSSLGYGVLVFESKKKVGGAVCCTGIIGKECFERFSLSGKAVLREVKSAKLFSPSGSLVRVERDEVQAYIVDRSTLDHSLAQRAQRAGARYFLGCRVKEIALRDSCVMVRTEQEGRREDFRAKVVVIANGFGSRLPAMLGLGKIGDFAIGAQAEVRAHELDEIEVYTGRMVAPGFFAWFVPTSGDKALTGLLCSRHQGRYLRRFISELSRQGRVTSSGFKITYGGVPLKPLSRTFGERVVVVGDAAGQVKPATGGGVYYGLLCADMAVETLRQAFGRGDLSAGELADYEKRWKKKLSRELSVGYWVHQFYGRLSDPQLDRIFDIIKEHRIEQTLLEDGKLSFDWHADFALMAVKHHALRGIVRGIKDWRPWRELSSHVA